MPRPREYKTKTFESKTLKGMQERLEEECNSMEKQGYRLHSFQCPGMISGACIMVFYKEGERTVEK